VNDLKQWYEKASGARGAARPNPLGLLRAAHDLVAGEFGGEIYLLPVRLRGQLDDPPTTARAWGLRPTRYTPPSIQRLGACGGCASSLDAGRRPAHGAPYRRACERADGDRARRRGLQRPDASNSDDLRLTASSPASSATRRSPTSIRVLTAGSLEAKVSRRPDLQSTSLVHRSVRTTSKKGLEATVLSSRSPASVMLAVLLPCGPCGGHRARGEHAPHLRPHGTRGRYVHAARPRGRRAFGCDGGRRRTCSSTSAFARSSSRAITSEPRSSDGLSSVHSARSSTATSRT
jgi:hypothetical protein